MNMLGAHLEYYAAIRSKPAVRKTWIDIKELVWSKIGNQMRTIV